MLRNLFKPILKLLRFFANPLFFYLAIIGNFTLLLATVAFYFVERGENYAVKNYFDSFYWGVTTITTVGFGDVVPKTIAGRIISILLMYSGTILFISFIGFLVHYWVGETVEKEIVPLEREVEEEEAIQTRMLKVLKDIDNRLAQLENKK